MKQFFRSMVVIFGILLAGVFIVQAEEGMWPLYQLKQLDWKALQKKGMHLSRKDVQKLEKAVVIIDGGTGEFVSRDGLVLTNHHVAFGALQRASTPEHNYIHDGFWAKTRDKEIPIPGYEVLVPRSFSAVTKKVLSVVKPGMSPLERFNALERKKQELVEKAEKNEGISARVVEMFSGLKYYLVTYWRYQDVRLVYAPPQDIGDYGGDIDNWMWPRHAGDFALFRVYASKDGKPAEYSADNVPFHPERYLKISLAGFKEGDFTFILGYPGTTYRYRTSHSVAFHVEVNYPLQLDMFQTAVHVLEEEAKKDPKTAISVAGFIKGLNNVIKNNKGMLDGFRKLHLLDKKKAFEKQFRQFLANHPALNKKYGSVLDDIGKLYADLRQFAPVQSWLGAVRFASLPSAVITAYRYAVEKEKPEAEREPGFTEKNMNETRKRLKYRAKQYVRSVDIALMKAMLKKLAAMPVEQQPAFLQEITGKQTGQAAETAIDKYVDDLFAKSRFHNLLDADTLFTMTLKQLKALHDPLIDFAEKYYQAIKPLEKKSKVFSDEVTRLRRKYMKALFAWKGEKLYPDANRTLRFTYGEIRGYQPRDAVIYLPQTRLAGVLEKNTGQYPFHAPQKLFELEAKKDFGPYVDPALGDVPVDFLHTTDITGGNSGSPVMNGNGELIGIAFDGNYEAMTSDYQFDESITRTISVDIRYVLFILDKFSGAKNILNELEIVGKPASN